MKYDIMSDFAKFSQIFPNFVKNCMKLKEFGPGGHIPLDPPQVQVKNVKNLGKGAHPC